MTDVKKADGAELWAITEQATKAVSETVSASVKLGQRYERERIVARLRKITELQRNAGPNERAEWGISYATQIACAAALEAATNVIEATE